jgi:hypothetical protein
VRIPPTGLRWWDQFLLDNENETFDQKLNDYLFFIHSSFLKREDDVTIWYTRTRIYERSKRNGLSLYFSAALVDTPVKYKEIGRSSFLCD